MLLAMWHPGTIEEVARECGAPLFRMRPAIREFLAAGLIEEEGRLYRISEEGVRRVEGGG
jgi:predicted transcriptional regulator